jgi:hypothetical protein
MNEKCTMIDGLHFSWMKLNDGRWNPYNIIIQFQNPKSSLEPTLKQKWKF